MTEIQRDKPEPKVTMTMHAQLVSKQDIRLASRRPTATPSSVVRHNARPLAALLVAATLVFSTTMLPSTLRAEGPAKAPIIACDTSVGLCVTGGGKALFEANKSLTFAALAKEDKKYAKKGAVVVRIEVLEGRASLFVDGRWMGLAGSEMALRPGRHLITLQDKSRVLARGILTLRDRSAPIELEMHHPDGDPSADTDLDNL